MFMSPQQRQLRLQKVVGDQQDLMNSRGFFGSRHHLPTTNFYPLFLLEMRDSAVHDTWITFSAKMATKMKDSILFHANNFVWNWYTQTLLPYEEEGVVHQHSSQSKPTKKKRPHFFKLGVTQIRKGWRLRSYVDYGQQDLAHQFLYKIFTSDGEFAGFNREC